MQNEKCNEVVKKAIKNDNKRFILGEIGIQKIVNEDVYLGYGNGVVYDTCRWFDDDYERTYCTLMQAEMIFSAINAGVFSIDCSLPIENEKLYYKILSVDKYGNI